MNEIPVLLLGYNRPDKLRQLISEISATKPPIVLIGIDGPSPFRKLDNDLVRQTEAVVESIDWNAKIQTRFRATNLGLRLAVTDSVSWAISEYGKVIVLEDDCKPGRQFISFASHMLNVFEHVDDVAHINGYNIVPPKNLSHPDLSIRLTRFPESYAWATWDRAWSHYDDSLEWALNCPLEELVAITGTIVSALRWRLTFRDAQRGRIDTWAYRWLATMWSHQWKMIAPNVNLVQYDGFSGGTHTLRNAKWSELPLGDINLENAADLLEEATQDSEADKWLGKLLFGESIRGFFEGIAASCAMETIRLSKNATRPFKRPENF